jgi:hypothetical protein
VYGDISRNKGVGNMRVLSLVQLCALSVYLAAAEPPVSTSVPPSGVQTIGWLTGCWAQESAAAVVEEHWMSPRAHSMLGIGRTIRNGKVVEYEWVLISERSGQLIYEAHPSGQPGAEFVANSATGVRAVFENPDHDFPQQIGYERTGRNALTAWIQGKINGSTRRVEFRYTRAPCVPGSDRS